MFPGVLVWIVVVTLVVAGCGGSQDGPVPPADQDGASGDVSDSALSDMTNEAFPEPLIDPDEVRSGGPPPDGIPPIDDPTFERANDVDWLSPQEPVLLLSLEGQTKGYPLRVMTWHEIVNDKVGGVPVAVTYCPLCNSGVAFEREVGGEVLSFGTSGLLYQDNLVMYDRQSESLWPQLTGQASIGTRTGDRLTAIPLGTVAWREFRQAHPGAEVLSQETGFDRPYGENPYVGYDDPDGDLLFESEADLDDRLPVKERVIGLSVGQENLAYVRRALVDSAPVQVSIGGEPVVLWHEPGQSSALDTDQIREGADVGTVAAFDPRLRGRTLTFTRREHRVVDTQTGSTWNVLGHATAGELSGATLRAVAHLDTFWFAWVLFHPDTGVEGA